MFLSRVMFVAVALALSVLSHGAYAGTVTYDFVDRPTYQEIYTVAGTITVKDTAIAAGTLLSTDVVSYSLTISHGAITDLSFSNLADLDLHNVSITATAIFVTPLSSTDFSSFLIQSSDLSFINWEYAHKSPATTNDTDQIYEADFPFDFNSGRQDPLWTNDTIDPAQFITPFDTAVREPTSAAVPEPSSLVIGMTLFGGCGLMVVRRRRQRQQPA